MAGMVYLVGAGPGDYRLISLKAVDCLKRAEVVVYDRLADDRILGWALEPGDVIAFHMLALHASAGVDGDRRRRVFSLRVLGDDMVHAPRAWVTSPPFPGLADRLPAGAPMDDPLFPVLWEQAA